MTIEGYGVSLSGDKSFKIADDIRGHGTYFGPSQEWYRDEWQRRAGCGPVTAALVLSYLSSTRPEMAPLCPSKPDTVSKFTDFMEIVWEYVTPTNRGLNSTELFASGTELYAKSVGCPLTAKIFDVPALPKPRRPFKEFADFALHSLENDCPVAFLNLSNGRLRNLDNWHWVTLISVSGIVGAQVAVASIADDGMRKSIDLSLWYKTTTLGGGLVSFV